MSVQRVRNVGNGPAIWTIMKFAGRFLSGRPLDGVHRTNSTFLQPGTRVVGQPHRDRPSRWMSLPGWKRAAWRVGLTVPTVATPVGLLTAPVPTIAADLSITSGLAAWGSYKATRAIQTRAHRKTWINPLHAALVNTVGQTPDVRPTEWLDVPTDFRTNEDAQVVVWLPAHFDGSPAIKKMTADIVSAKLAMQDIDVSWRLAGATPHVIIKQAPRPPDTVLWANVQELIASAPESAPLIGLGQRRKPIAVDLDTESPHILLSMSTGGGKSVTLRAIAAQILKNGGRVVICDRKKTSHTWARGLPGVIYAKAIEEIHEAIIMVAQEGARRFDLIDEHGSVDAIANEPRVLLLMEEMNATMRKLQKYWQAVRDPKTDPKQSPAVEAFEDTLFMGREARTHVIAVGQLMTASAMGGPEIRECFSVRILARYSRNAWKMLVPEVWPPPKTSRHSGRVQVVIAGEAHETQVLFATNEEARQFVLAGRAQPAYADASHRPSPSTVSDLGHEPSNVLGHGPEPVVGKAPPLRLVKPAFEYARQPFAEDPNAPIGLSEAAKKGLIVLSDTPAKTLEIMRAARKRDPEFPMPVAERGQEKLYLPAELVKWARNRPSATGTER